VNLKLARVVLASDGYEVRTAVDAAAAFALLTEFHPRLILMDLQLPGMDGLEATRRIKADPHTRDIIVVALTAYAMKGDDAKAIAAGCDGYVSKPIDTRTFPGYVAALLREREPAA
jgi:CheY-like chemotaxis protein